MKTDISIKMNNGISGTLIYKSNIAFLEIPVENTGDYSRGTLVFINEIIEQLSSSDSKKIESQVLRDLQQWSIESGQKLCW